MCFLIRVMIVSVFPAAVLQCILVSSNMSINNVSKISEDKLKSRLKYLVDINNYPDGCGTCGFPRLLHKGTTFTCNSKAAVQEECPIW